MSDDSRPAELQFERAETGSPSGAPHCAVCARPIADRYWEHRGRMLCDNCRGALVDSWTKGSGLGRFARAALLGTGAAAAGALVYWAVAELFHVQLSIIALLIGFVVGVAVRYGARGRGGWRYQALAMFLTYTSVVSAFLPAIWQAAQQEGLVAESEGFDVDSPEPTPPELLVREAQGSPGDAKRVEPGTEPAPMDLPGETGVGHDAATTRVVGVDSAANPSLGGCLLAGLLLVGLVYASPFLAGFENFLGWIILAIGLYEAWKLNQPEDRAVRGPFAVGGGSAPPLSDASA